MTSRKLAKELFRARAMSEYKRLAALERASVELIVNSESLAPEEITKRIGMEPTQTYRKGDFIVEIEKSKHHHSAHLWVYCTENHCSSKIVEDHLKWLINEQLYNKRQAIKDLQVDGATVLIYAYTKAFINTIYMRLDPDIFQKLASLNVEVQFETKFSNLPPRR